MKCLVFTAALFLASCATNSGVVPMGRDLFMVSRQAATGFGGMGDLKAKTLRDAEAHCAASHQTFEVVGTSESKPPYILANYPRVELTFRCVAQ